MRIFFLLSLVFFLGLFGWSQGRIIRTGEIPGISQRGSFWSTDTRLGSPKRGWPEAGLYHRKCQDRYLCFIFYTPVRKYMEFYPQSWSWHRLLSLTAGIIQLLRVWIFRKFVPPGIPAGTPPSTTIFCPATARPFSSRVCSASVTRSLKVLDITETRIGLIPQSRFSPW